MAILKVSTAKHWVALFCCWLGPACTTAEGALFRNSSSSASGAGGSAPEPARCSSWQASLAATAEIRLGGSEVWGERVVVVGVMEGEARLLQMDFETRQLLNLGALGDDSSIGEADLLALDATALHVTFQNHSLAGMWRIYRAVIALDGFGVALASALPVSEGGAESVGPMAASLGADVYVAYRRDRALALSATLAGGPPSVTVLDSRAPHPTIVRVVASPLGVVVLSLRDGPELEYFDPAGLHVVGEPIGAALADIAPGGPGLIQVSLADGALVRTEKQLDASSVSSAQIAGFDQPIVALRLVRLASTLGLVTLSTAPGSSQLDLYELSEDAATLLGSAALASTDPEKLRVESVAGRVVVFSRHATGTSPGIDATVFCDENR